MVNDKKRKAARNKNGVQNLGVQGMRAPRASLRGHENGIRYLNVGPVLAHYRHISTMDKAYYRGCRLCREGLQAVHTVVQVKPPEPSVAKDTGVDEEGDGAPALSDEWPEG